MIEFKTLEPDDIEVRVQQVTEKGCSLLLYKDARTDARILDEAVGNENWDCDYSEVHGMLFCTVGIRCELPSGETSWVYKSDTGSPSNMEPEKGYSSDCFKRACTKWGIGRELYTAPFIWVDKGMLQKHEYNQKRGKWTCNDKFHVSRIKVDDGRITDLAIANQHDFTVYQMRSATKKRANGGNGTAKAKTAPQNGSTGRYDGIRALKAEAMGLGIKEDGIESGIATIIQDKPKKDMTDDEIKAVERYLRGLIEDKRELEGGAA